MARLCGELQATLERIALGLQGGSDVPGRRPKEVVDAVRLLLSGFRAGSDSAALELDRPESAGRNTLLQEALDVLETGSAALTRGEPPPEGFSTHVIDGLIRLASGLGGDFITDVVIRSSGSAIMTIDAPFRQTLREARRRVRHDETTIVGLLQMSDFAPAAVRCRIDTIDASILCTFDESLSSSVLACLNSRVVASGIGGFLPSGILRSLDINEVTTVSRGRSASLDELARQQGVTAWPVDPLWGDFGLKEDIGDNDFAVFLAAALSSRRAD